VRDADKLEVACGAVPKPPSGRIAAGDRPWDRKS
jgi:hypothetical protein